MAATQQDKRKAKLRKWGMIGGVAVVAVLVIGFLLRPKPLPVSLWAVEAGKVEATVSNNRAGTVKACRRAKMSPQAGGQISQLKVKKGQRVQKGQVLMELWHEDLHAQEDLAVEQAKTAQSHVKEACALAEAAKRDADRNVQLKEQGFISSQILDRSQTDAKARQAACEAAKGEVEQSEARIKVARAALDRMMLRAPFSGVVADISGELGEFSTPSPPGIPTLPAIDLIDDSCLYVSAPIDEVDAAEVKVGQPSRITLDAIKGRTFAGTVKRIAPYVIDLEKQARTVEVEVSFNEVPKDENLLVGYSADIEIIHQTHDNVVRIPTQYLLEGRKVMLYKPSGVLEEREVKTGLSNWQFTEVLSGLQPGDQIVTSLEQKGIKPGVKAKPESKKSDSGQTVK